LATTYASQYAETAQLVSGGDPPRLGGINPHCRI
jgi:hypothetical protein